MPRRGRRILAGGVTTGTMSHTSQCALEGRWNIPASFQDATSLAYDSGDFITG
jgi:hypothetical protein